MVRAKCFAILLISIVVIFAAISSSRDDDFDSHHYFLVGCEFHVKSRDKKIVVLQNN